MSQITELTNLYLFLKLFEKVFYCIEKELYCTSSMHFTTKNLKTLLHWKRMMEVYIVAAHKISLSLITKTHDIIN